LINTNKLKMWAAKKKLGFRDEGAAMTNSAAVLLMQA
jgi:hypothetical protein